MNILISILTVAPNGMPLYIAILSCIIFVSLFKIMRNGYIKEDSMRIALAVTILIQALVVMAFKSNYDKDGLLKSLLIILLVATIPGGKIKISENRIWILIAFFYLIFTSIIIYVNIEPISNYLFNIYPANSQINIGALSFNDLITRRLSGIYYNPNQYAKAINFLTVAFLIGGGLRSKSSFLFSLSALFVIILSGSRTGALIQLAVILIYAILSVQKNEVRKIVQVTIILIPCSLIFLIYLFSNTSAIELNLRSFDFTSEENSGSLYLKYDFTLKYIMDASIAELMFGVGDMRLVELNYSSNRLEFFDQDIGYLLYAYGVVGLILMIFILIHMIIKNGLGSPLILPLLLWMLTSGLITNIRSLTIILLISLISNNKQRGVGNA